MSDRTDYRTALRNKLRDAVPNGLADTFFSDTELNEMLANGVRRLYPYVYVLTEEAALAPDTDGKLDLTSVPIDAQTVTRVFDDDSDETIYGWRARGTSKLINVDISNIASTVTVEYLGAYTMPDDDVTTVTLPDIYFNWAVVAATMDGLERLATGRINFRGFKPGGETGVDENEVLNALDTLKAGFESEVDSKGMGLPAVGSG